MAGCADRTLDSVNTILDGNKTNNVLVLSAPDVAAKFLVEGLTLRNGWNWSSKGGGLYVMVGNGGEVMVTNSFISDSVAYSGGVFYLEATTVRLTNNIISGNTGLDASAGLYLKAKTATLTNNAISAIRPTTMAACVYAAPPSP
jgi:hypothetical protein